MDMFPRFSIWRFLIFRKYPIFHPAQGVFAHNFTFKNDRYTVHFFKNLGDHRFLDPCV